MEADRGAESRGEGGAARRILLDVAALERAFEDTSGETRRYLHVFTGTVTVLHHGSADSAAFSALDHDARYLRIEPVSRRQQYRWIQEYIATVEDLELAAQLRKVAAGKGAFARFQAVLAPRLREKSAWSAFRIERLHAAIAAWLTARGILVTAPLVAPDQAMEPGGGTSRRWPRTSGPAIWRRSWRSLGSSRRRATCRGWRGPRRPWRSGRLPRGCGQGLCGGRSGE